MSSASTHPAATGESSNGSTRPQILLVLVSVFLAYLAQQTLNPIIAPLARTVGLAEWQIGATVSVAAIMVVATSQFWGRRSQSWGRKPVLVTAMLIATTAMALFAVVSWLGMRGAIAGTVLFASFVLLRGVLFGTAIAAVPPTAQAYIANVTEVGAARVKGMAGVGAVQGIAMVGGAVLGGSLSAFGLLTPIIVVPVLMTTSVLLIALRLRPESATELVQRPPRISPSDTRVWPYLLAGFGIFTALGFIQVAIGFLVQDRLGLAAEDTGLVTGAALLCAGLGMIAAQTVIVPRSGWGPVRLLRAGAVTGTIGFAVLIPEGGLALIIVSMLLIGTGIGIATPGYTAGPSMAMKPEEQGGLAGLIGATNGLTFVVAPILGTALYGVGRLIPIVVALSVMAAVVAFLFVHPRFRRAPVTPTAAQAH